MKQIKQKELQRYFKSLCKSFYIVYKQVKRLENEEDELGKNYPKDEIDVIDTVLEMLDEEKDFQKYITCNSSKEELQARKEELEQSLEKYKKKEKELENEKCEWSHNYGEIVTAIETVIRTIADNESSIIVSSKEEITALMYFFRRYSVREYRVINTERENYKLFPRDKEEYLKFYQAYCLEDDEEMKKVCRKYY